MVIKKISRYWVAGFGALFAAALLLTPLGTAHAAGLPTDEFKAKTPGIPDSTIQTISDFDLNKAKVVGGGAPVADSVAPGATAITSPDGNFKLIQGTRMFVEYVNKAAVKDNGGKYQKLPGSITLQWDGAAVDKTDGEKLDVQLTISNINFRMLDRNNKKKTFSRSDIESARFAVLVNWQEMEDISHRKDLHASGVTTPAGWYKAKGFSSLSTITDEVADKMTVTSSTHYTINFLNKDGSENGGTYNMITTDPDNPGYAGRPGGWWRSYDRSDPGQEHIKLLTPGDTLYVSKDTVLWTNSGSPKREAWSTKPLFWYHTEGWALSHIRSGSTIEYGNIGGMNLFAQLDPLLSKITVTKLGNGKTGGVTLPTGTNVNFTYEVKNVGIARVDKIMVADSKGVKVTCPKATLNPGESMTCTGKGVVK